MKFNILHVEWSSGWGGQEQRILLECRKVMALGHSVLIACQPGSGILRGAHEQEIPVIEVVIRGSWDINAVLAIYNIIKKYNITVVNTHSGKDTWVGGFAAKMARTPLFVRTRHLAIPISRNPFNFIHKLADGIITTGESVRTALIENNGVATERIVSIATGVTLDRFSPVIDGTELRKEMGISKDARIISIVAILRKVKRHDVFLQAAKLLLQRYPNLRFLIVGDGPMRDDIVARVSELGLEQSVIMTGHREDIPQVFAISDVVVLTSDKEGVPQSLSQAMAMKRPVVAASVGGIPDLITDGETGLFAEAGNPASFAERISELLDNESLRDQLGSAACRHIHEHFTDEIMAQQTIEFYQKLVGLKST
ncbi:MAG: glycosyltransferase family 4 protein [Geobacteraceae bacterium]|nr:glycosyltransferase family 4 protein [Geobacteraceae bacterium]